MKKVLVGCLVIVAIGAIGAAVAGYFLYRAAQPVLQGATTYYDRAKEIGALGERIANREPFAIPSSGALTQTQVDRFLRVQERVVNALGPRWKEFEARVRELDRNSPPAEAPSFTSVLAMFSDASTVLVEARRAQVDALNAEGFSSGEYNWVRVAVYSAAGLELARGLDWNAIEQAIKTSAAQAGVEAPPLPAIQFPDTNRALVKPHVARLKEWWGLAFLGL